MSLAYECFAELRDGSLVIPDEIAARLRLRGIERVRLNITSVADDQQLLSQRGITAGTIERIAAVQHLDPDVVTVVLGGEGAAHGSELGRRLLRRCGGGAK